ncbi:MAG: hypothetical protein ACK5JT_19490, partial [Hyphomicrobiaceae bacterium]
MSGNFVWLERSSDYGEIRPVVRSLAPVAITRPLVRIGGDGDGGYLLPDDLDGVAAVISPGVSTTVEFDLDMAGRGAQIYMADASVSGPPVNHERFHFLGKYLDVFDDDQNIRLDGFCSSIAREHDGDQLLQMDIEGAEYRVLLDASDETLRR